MKNLTNSVYENLFAEYILSNEEMTCVRGGDAEDVLKPSGPPVIP